MSTPHPPPKSAAASRAALGTATSGGAALSAPAGLAALIAPSVLERPSAA